MKRTRRTYSRDYKLAAVKKVIKQGLSYAEINDLLAANPEVADRLRSYVEVFEAELNQNIRPAGFIKDAKTLTKRE